MNLHQVLLGKLDFLKIFSLVAQEHHNTVGLRRLLVDLIEPEGQLVNLMARARVIDQDEAFFAIGLALQIDFTESVLLFSTE